ncbi:hypothetical protein [Streptomyces sp. NBC_00893]|uniref:hypothetical protein n=1 Tax=Streptomyces sp. NBC_00893 TaxID=2975862 RepID=UPI00225915EE|nr:hypothetical protein [Streptomyces sp. NBC_00893]MCX4851722.1 hypothetical protein [Streptomyces sp. NBC_00893]
MPVAFVFTGKTEAQRESRMLRLEQATRAYFAGTKYPGGGITAVDYHQAVPVVVTDDPHPLTCWHQVQKQARSVPARDWAGAEWLRVPSWGHVGSDQTEGGADEPG